MDLNTIINVTMSVASPSLSRIGFGEPGIFAYVPSSKIPLSSRTKRYSSSTGLADMVADGFLTTDPAYLAAQAILSQSPRPATFKVLCGRNSFYHDFDLLPTVYADGELIEVTLTQGATARTYSITCAGYASLSDAADALAAAINADVSGWGTAGSADFTCNGPTGGAPAGTVEITTSGGAGTADLLWYISALTNVKPIDETTDRGIAADLAAILAADSDWYELIPADAFGAAELTLLAASIQSATNKVMSAATQDYDVIEAGGGIAATLTGLDRTRTSLWYSPHSMAEYLAGAVAGRFLPETPGTVARMHKSVSGVTPATLTAAEGSYARANYCNTYEGVAVGGVTIANGNLFKGWTSGATETFMDTIRLIDALVFEVQYRVMSLFRASKKVPYTDHGIGQIKGAILAAVKVYEATDPPGLDQGSAFCNVPAAADVSASDRANRLLPNVTFGATLAGAIATVTINGTLEY